MSGFSPFGPSAIATPVAPGATGNGGTLTIETDSLKITNAAQIFSTTFGFGKAGDLQIKAKDESNNVPASEYSKFAFLNQAVKWEDVFDKLSELPNQNIYQLNLWMFAPGRRRRDYPDNLKVSQSLSCKIDKDQHYRIGIPYQLYRCKK